MLQVLLALVDRVISPDQYGILLAGVIVLALVHSWAKGPSLLDREERLEAYQLRARDKDSKAIVTAGLNEMAGRVVLVATGGMTPMGLVVIAMLAQQGAHIVVLVPDLSSLDVIQMIDLLRESSRNENIFAESCDMGDMASISEFSKRWFTGKMAQVHPEGTSTAASAVHLPGIPTTEAHRLDTVLFLPMPEGSTPMGSSPDQSYLYNVLGPFHLVESLLPSLQQQPLSRDVRIVSAISPWYAAGMARFDSVMKTNSRAVFEPWTFTGASSLHWIILAKEWQRRFDMIASADQRPRTRVPGMDAEEDSAPVSARRSHISSVLVCPGFEISSQLSVFFVTDMLSSRVHALVLWLLWLILYPFFWVIGRPTQRAAEAVVWAICARLESEMHTFMRTHMSQGVRTPARNDVEDARRWPGIQPGHVYREGRRVDPPVPASCRGAGAAALWASTEAAVHAKLKSA